MSLSDKPREPRAPRRARPRLSLKMQAIGFLSRREHSRQELRRKLLDSLRKRAREEAALIAAAEKAARELAQALSEQPSNGIDDAFAPTLPALEIAPARAGRGRAAARDARAPSRAREGARAGDASTVTRPPTHDRPGVETLTLASGAPLPEALRAALAAAASDTSSTSVTAPSEATAKPASIAAEEGVGSGATAPTSLHVGGQRAAVGLVSRPPLHRTSTPEAPDEFIDVDADAFDLPSDDLAGPSTARLDVTELELADPEAAVDQLLDWLVANKYLSEPRFVESRINARQRKQGTLLIKLELQRHGLALEPEQAAELRETELARARALWQRKFGEVAGDAKARAKQARFLAARGFAADVVRRVVGGLDED